MTTTQRENPQPFPLKWGQLALMLLVAALAAVFEPTYLLLAGAARGVWCLAGGQILRAITNCTLFVLVYFAIVLASATSSISDAEPERSPAPLPTAVSAPASR